MPGYEWVSVHEASRRLNRSVSTIRRQIGSGELVGEREPLARGSTRDRYRVRLDVPMPPEPTHHDAPPSSTDEAPETPQDAPALTMRTLDIFDALLVANAETMERQAARIAALEREAGALGSSVDAYRREVEWLQAELERARRPWWKLW